MIRSEWCRALQSYLVSQVAQIAMLIEMSKRFLGTLITRNPRTIANFCEWCTFQFTYTWAASHLLRSGWLVGWKVCQEAVRTQRRSQKIRSKWRARCSSDGLFGGALLALPFTTGVIFDRNGTVPVVKLSGRSGVQPTWR